MGCPHGDEPSRCWRCLQTQLAEAQAERDEWKLCAEVEQAHGIAVEVENERLRERLEKWADDIACPDCQDGTTPDYGSGERVECSCCEGTCINWPAFRAALEGKE